MPPRSESLRRAVAPGPRTPVAPHRTLLCHVETQLCYVIFFGHLSFFIQLAILSYVFFLSSFWDFSSSSPSLCTAKCCRTSASAMQGHAWLPQFERKEKSAKKKRTKNGNLFKTDKGRDKREMPCTIFFCGCCVHVSPPITNVTFQLH